jgi:hypothetical protein
VSTVLIVQRPFAGYRRGDAISDAAAVSSVLASADAGRVVRVSSVAAEPAATAAPAPQSVTSALQAAEAALQAAEAAAKAKPAS